MENNRLDFLPNEIIDKILLFRDTHPIANIIKPYINNYNDYNKDFDDDDNIPFNYYVFKISCYRLRKNNKSFNMICCECGIDIDFYDKYLINTNRNTIHCCNCADY